MHILFVGGSISSTKHMPMSSLASHHESLVNGLTLAQKSLSSNSLLV